MNNWIKKYCKFLKFIINLKYPIKKEKRKKKKKKDEDLMLEMRICVSGSCLCCVKVETFYYTP